MKTKRVKNDISCDFCMKTAPLEVVGHGRKYVHDMITVSVPDKGERSFFDFCSWECLATFVKQIRVAKKYETQGR